MRQSYIWNNAYPSISDQEAESVVGGANFPIPPFWRRLLVSALELVLEAVLKELKRAYQDRHRGAELGCAGVNLQG